jgi:hypothetical protein
LHLSKVSGFPSVPDDGYQSREKDKIGRVTHEPTPHGYPFVYARRA